MAPDDCARVKLAVWPAALADLSFFLAIAKSQKDRE